VPLSGSMLPEPSSLTRVLRVIPVWSGPALATGVWLPAEALPAATTAGAAEGVAVVVAEGVGVGPCVGDGVAVGVGEGA